MQNITLEDLDLVCGGTGAVTPITGTTPTNNTASTGTGTGSGGNDALLTSLNSIGSSIKDLSHKNNGGLFGGGNSMLMLGMALAMRRNDGGNTIVVNGGGGGCGHGGFSVRGRW